EARTGEAACVENCSVAPDMEPCGNHACVTSLGCVVHVCVHGKFRATPDQISDACRKGTGLITEDGPETRIVIGHETAFCAGESILAWIPLPRWQRVCDKPLITKSL